MIGINRSDWSVGSTRHRRTPPASSPDRGVARARDLNRASDLAAQGITVRPADYDDPARLDAALRGIQRAHLGQRGRPARPTAPEGHRCRGTRGRPAPRRHEPPPRRPFAAPLLSSRAPGARARPAGERSFLGHPAPRLVYRELRGTRPSRGGHRRTRQCDWHSTPVTRIPRRLCGRRRSCPHWRRAR